ncbi:MAG: ATP-binding protein [Vulcanimicrobiaceae bacterium]
MNAEFDRASGGDADSARRVRLRIPPTAPRAQEVRAVVTSFAKLQGVRSRDLESLIFAVGEALANAIEHAGSEEIEVRCSVDEGLLQVSIADSGRGFDAVPKKRLPLPDALSERGRGIPIMQRCTDVFRVRSLPGGGTEVVLGCYLDRPRGKRANS